MSTQKLIDLSKAISPPALRKALGATAIPLVEALLGITNINQKHSDFTAHSKIYPPANFFEGALDTLDVSYEITKGTLDYIPADGPVIVVSNHPFGGLDGIVLGALLKKVRKDSKLLANFLLNQIPELEEEIISVSPFGSNSATQFNRSGIKDAISWLEEGKCLGTFPSGFVSHYQGPKIGVADKNWNPSIARIAKRTGATIIPIFFEGHNSSLFEIAGMLHPRLRTALLPRELINKGGKTINVRIGTPVLPSRIRNFEKSADLVKFLQMRSSVLAHAKADPLPKEAPEANYQPIADRRPTEDLIKDIENLPDDCLITTKGSYQVYFATAQQLPNILHEIGRTREITFRPVGEGTGKPLDLDEYDQHYLHLFLWNNETCEIVGAYRVGKVREIVAKYGPEGLYSNTIFEYSDDAFDELNGALELGRSYVVPEYQRKGTSLFLLWRGILRFADQNPQYSKLFGAVSISDEYHPLSKALIVHFLRNRKMVAGYEKKIKPRVRPNCENIRTLRKFDYPNALPSLDHISSLVSEIEHDRKGAPTLLKHYLQMNGVILGIGVDQGFNDALDGFILVDLEKADPALVQKYVGKKKTKEV